MLDLETLGEAVAARRRELRISQAELARRSGLSRATVVALESGRLRELGFNKVTTLLGVLAFELRISTANERRPVLDELLEEAERDPGLGR